MQGVVVIRNWGLLTCIHVLMETMMRMSMKTIGAAIVMALAVSAVSFGVASAEESESWFSNPLFWAALFVVFGFVAFEDASDSK
jgi:hypothetical protein